MRNIKTIGIVGMGQMGRGIAQVAAQAGFNTLAYDSFKEGLEQGLQFIKKQLSRGVEKKKWDEQAMEKTLLSLRPTDSLNAFKDCDLVIEAITENKDIKFGLFKELAKAVGPDTILASNTSSIPITEIAAQVENPKRVVGMHFMNPVPVMKLVEGIMGLETDRKVLDTIKKTAERMGKIFIQVDDRPGFAVNRVLMPMINEAVYALYEGLASIEDIDTGLKLGANWPMGPLALADFIGLDTCLAIMETLYKGFGDPKYRPCPLLRQYVCANRLGKKSGRGFYDYQKKDT